MTTEELNKLKSIELEILLMFDNYCKDKGLKYYLIGGALLGSARYGGFIPWDDDIDVAMPRDDYEKLKLLWCENGVDGYFLQHENSDSKFARCIMKVRKNNTEILEERTRNVKMHQGIYIDVFPMDYVSCYDEKKLSKRAGKIRRYMTLRTIKSGYDGNYKLIKNIIRLGMFWLPVRVIDKKIYRLCTCENGGDRKYIILFLHNYNWDRQIHEADVFGEGSICLLEGKAFVAPRDTKAFLKKVFGGDYMNDPPEEQKKNPHKYVSVKFN